MDSIIDIFRKRRSQRRYIAEPIDEKTMKQILEVGITSPTGDNFKTIELILIKDNETLKELANMRKAGTKMLEGAGAAIIVLADSNKTDLWIEDASISASYMHLAADALGIGSCWIQVRARDTVDGGSFEKALCVKLSIPEHLKPLCILSLGNIDSHLPANNPGDINWKKVHYEKNESQ